ncbi:hypothetical protein MPSEU_000193500 [Mayamaea pseudoterrestris]|nr:hypothetical protein MPSEU_000193500 [Mayamaea pseudoterrestris]
MVIRSGFEVQLVHADSKLPFKEHEKDGKIYVEVEPDAEYFIAVRRVDMSGPQAILGSYKLDGKALGYYSTHTAVETMPRFLGIVSRTNGIEKKNAFRFSKPRMATNGGGFGGTMGSADIHQLYEGMLFGLKPVADFTTTFDAASAGAANAATGKKKFLLSTSGSMTVKTETEPNKMFNSYEKCNLIDTITLYYCSALGLIQVGVLAKPDTARASVCPPIKKPVGPVFSTVKDPADPSKLIDMITLTDDE